MKKDPCLLSSAESHASHRPEGMRRKDQRSPGLSALTADFCCRRRRRACREYSIPGGGNCGPEGKDEAGGRLPADSDFFEMRV